MPRSATQETHGVVPVVPRRGTPPSDHEVAAFTLASKPETVPLIIRNVVQYGTGATPVTNTDIHRLRRAGLARRNRMGFKVVRVSDTVFDVLVFGCSAKGRGWTRRQVDEWARNMQEVLHAIADFTAVRDVRIEDWDRTVQVPGRGMRLYTVATSKITIRVS